MTDSRIVVRPPNKASGVALVLAIVLCAMAFSLTWFVYTSFRIDVGSGEIAILTRKTGKDLRNGEEIAPTPEHKGIQREVLTEGRYFRNPYTWSWEVVKQVEVASGEMGVKVSLTGDDLGYGEFLAHVDEKGEATTKGIVPGVLNPGRYPIHPHLYTVEIHKPITIPAGFKGVVTNLAAPLAKDSNKLLVEKNERGVQATALEPGTHYVNPYVTRIDRVEIPEGLDGQRGQFDSGRDGRPCRIHRAYPHRRRNTPTDQEGERLRSMISAKRLSIGL